MQHARTATGTVAGEILAAIAAENAGAAPMGSVGAVVGANLAAVDEDLAVNGPLLAPGYRRAGRRPRRPAPAVRRRRAVRAAELVARGACATDPTATAFATPPPELETTSAAALG